MISKIISTNPAIMADEIQRLKDQNITFADINSNSGVKNLNAYPYYQTTRTVSGITFTDNLDGTITITNTAIAGATFQCHPRTRGAANLILPNGKYKLSGCPKGGSLVTYCMRAAITVNNASLAIGRDYGEGVIINLTGDDYSTKYTTLGIFIDVSTGFEADSEMFTPTLELITLADPEAYVPYAKTNGQLTSDVNKLLCTEITAGSYYLTATVNSEGAITYSWEVIE